MCIAVHLITVIHLTLTWFKVQNLQRVCLVLTATEITWTSLLHMTVSYSILFYIYSSLLVPILIAFCMELSFIHNNFNPTY